MAESEELRSLLVGLKLNVQKTKIMASGSITSWQIDRETVTDVIFMAAVICSDFGAPQNKVCHCFHFFPIYLPKVMGPDTMILVF